MRPVTSEDIYLMKWVRDPQISPDGTKILFEVKTVTDRGEVKPYNPEYMVGQDKAQAEIMKFYLRYRQRYLPQVVTLRNQGSLSV